MLFLQQDFLSSSRVHEELIELGEEMSLVTVKRELSKMAINRSLSREGAGRSRVYGISVLGRIFADVDAHEYCTVEPDKRYGLEGFNFGLLPDFPPEIFSKKELEILENATNAYRRRIEDLPAAIQKKELERLVIELSWKSSKIEGNTYTLLDTEKLILENKEAVGHDKKESAMILNHKDAFFFVREHARNFKMLTRTNLEQLHAILIKNLSVAEGLRTKPVGITGSKYRPLDNVYQKLFDSIRYLQSQILASFDGDIPKDNQIRKPISVGKNSCQQNYEDEIKKRGLIKPLVLM